MILRIYKVKQAMDTKLSSAPIPRMPIQVWLARGGLVLVVILLILLQIVGLGEVTIQSMGDTTVYKFESYILYFTLPFAFAFFIIAIVYWIQRGIYRFFSIFLFFAGLVSLFFTFVATTDKAHVSVSPTKLVREVGLLQYSSRQEIDLSEVAYLSVFKSVRENGPDFELVAILKSDGSEIRIPIHDMMKTALPQILANAKKLEVVIADSSNGTPVPDGLLD